MRYEQPEMEILLFGAKVKTDLVINSLNTEGNPGNDNIGDGDWQS